MDLRILTVVVLVVLVLLPSQSAGGAPGASDPPASPAPGSIDGPAVFAPPTIEKEIEAVLARFKQGDTAEAFGLATQFLQIEERTEAERQGVRRAKLMIEKIPDISKLLPPPADRHAGDLAQLLFAAAQTLEASDAGTEAVAVYERIANEYPTVVWQGGASSDPVSKHANERIRWLKEKHPWVHKSQQDLLSKLRTALEKHDSKTLAALINRIGFWSGPFQSEGGPDDPERVLKHLESVWPRGPVTVSKEVEPFSDLQQQIFLKVAGWTGEHPEIYFICQKVTEGWHWTGVAFASKSDVGTIEDTPPSGSASPSPDAK